MKMSKIKNRELFLYIVLIVFILIGVYMRIAFRPSIIPINIAGFYYYRASYLAENGEYIKLDTEGMYPYSYRENYPPFLVLFSVALYKISMSNNLLVFLSYFPIMIFVLISIAGFYTLSRIFNNFVGVLFVALFSIVPSALRVTEKGFYTEDSLGIFLFIGLLYCIIRLKENKKYLYLGIVLLTLFILTWQTFVILYAGLLLILIFSLNDGQLRKKILLLSIIPLFISYFVSVILLGLAYSPFQIFKETYLSFTLNKDLDYRIAFERNDLIRTNTGMFLEEYSFFSIFLIFGALFSLSKFTEHRYRSLFILSALSIFSVLTYLKLRYFALPMIVIMSSIGIYKLFEFKKSNKSIIYIFLTIAVIIMIPQIYSRILEFKVPRCEVEFLAYEPFKIDYPAQINAIITSTGGNPLCEQNTFGGLHFEIEGAKILSAAINSKYSKTGVSEMHTESKINWFETFFYCLKNKKTANLTVDILPNQKNVNLYYRCWMPDECNLEPPEDMLPGYKKSWRNEKCIKRNPDKWKLCKVDVYAGHKTLQKYFCNEKIFMST